MFFLGKCASDRFGEAETLKRGQPMTFQLASGVRRYNSATHIAGKDDIPRGLGCRFVNRKAETDRRRSLRNRNNRFQLSFRIRARGHYDRARPIIRSRPYMMQSGTVFKLNAFFGPGSSCRCHLLTGVDPGIDRQNRSTRWRVETNLPCSRPQPSVAPATRRQPDLYQAAGRSCTGIRHDIRVRNQAEVSKSWRPAALLRSGVPDPRRCRCVSRSPL